LPRSCAPADRKRPVQARMRYIRGRPWLGRKLGHSELHDAVKREWRGGEKPLLGQGPSGKASHPRGGAVSATSQASQCRSFPSPRVVNPRGVVLPYRHVRVLTMDGSAIGDLNFWGECPPPAIPLGEGSPAAAVSPVQFTPLSVVRNIPHAPLVSPPRPPSPRREAAHRHKGGGAPLRTTRVSFTVVTLWES